MFLCCEPSHYLIQLSRYDQVLTGRWSNDDHDSVPQDLGRPKLPSRPTDPSQNRWLRDRVWDMIATCWNEEPRLRCELSVMRRVFSMPGPRDALVEFPPVGHKNLTRLTEELPYTFLIHPLRSSELATLKAVQDYISNAVLKSGVSPTVSPSVETAALAERFYKVSFLHSSFTQPLTPLVGRLYRVYHPPYNLLCFTCGSDFVPTPSSLSRESSQTWNSVMNLQTTPPLDLRISGKEITMGSRYASRQFAHMIQPV